MGKFAILSPLLWVLMVNSCSPVHADDVYIGGWSKHLNDNNKNKDQEPTEYQFNGDHSLFAYEYDNYVVGHFYNSYYDSTWFASRRFPIATAGDFSLNLHAGITYGYKSCEFSKLDYSVEGPPVYCPMIVPEISYDRYMIRPTLMIVGNAFVVTFKINFN